MNKETKRIKLITGPLSMVKQQYPNVYKFITFDLEKFEESVTHLWKKDPMEPVLAQRHYNDDVWQQERTETENIATASWVEIRDRLNAWEVEMPTDLVNISEINEKGAMEPENWTDSQEEMDQEEKNERFNPTKNSFDEDSDENDMGEENDEGQENVEDSDQDNTEPEFEGDESEEPELDGENTSEDNQEDLDAYAKGSSEEVPEDTTDL